MAGWRVFVNRVGILVIIDNVIKTDIICLLIFKRLLLSAYYNIIDFTVLILTNKIMYCMLKTYCMYVRTHR